MSDFAWVMVAISTCAASVSAVVVAALIVALQSDKMENEKR